MSATLDKLDACAASLSKLYQKEGVFAVTVRNAPTGDAVRAIYPQRDVAIVSEFLRLVADTIFDGPAKIRYPDV